MKRRVVLMNPPTAAPSGEVLLNLAYLSSVLKDAGHEVLVLDATAPHEPLSEKEIKEKILDFKPDFIGVTLTITYIPQTYEYLMRLRPLEIPIVAGGPHANCCPEEVLSNGADIVVIGEGEMTIIELMEYFDGKKKLKNIAGLCYKKKDGSFHRTKNRPLIENLDSLPFPDYSEFPIKKYTGSDDPSSNPIFWSIFSSRGCPYNCIFCSSHNVFGRTFRTRSPKNVFKEIESLVKTYGASIFAFQDDEAFIDKKRIIEFCDLVKKSKLELKFSARLRIDNFDEELLKELKSIGFRRLSFGTESFNDDTLKKINKMYNVEKMRKGINLLDKVQFLAVSFTNMIGFPWETPEHLHKSLEETRKFPKSLIYFNCTVTPVPYPNTVLYEKYHKEYSFTDWWLDPKRNHPPLKSEISHAFFMLFLSVQPQEPLYTESQFWTYSPEMKKAMVEFCWKTSSLYLKKCLGPIEYKFAFKFSRVSHKIWKWSPLLERILFYPFKCLVKILQLDKKAMFKYRL